MPTTSPSSGSIPTHMIRHSHTSRRLPEAGGVRDARLRDCRRHLAATGRRRPRGLGERPAWSISIVRSTRMPRVRIVTSKNPEALEVYRHSTAHLLAAAVTALFPGAQCGIGPPTDEGFFYDFVVERPFVPEDLAAIEAKMRELAGRGLRLRAADVAAAGGDRLLHAARRAAQGAADRGEDGRPAGSVGLHDQGSGHVRGLLRRPARPVDGQAEGASS